MFANVYNLCLLYIYIYVCFTVAAKYKNNVSLPMNPTNLGTVFCTVVTVRVLTSLVPSASVQEMVMVYTSGAVSDVGSAILTLLISWVKIHLVIPFVLDFPTNWKYLVG